MDLITHALLGFVLSRVGLNRLTRDAAWVTIIAALLPDIDLFFPFEWQRGITHSWLLVPALGFWAVVIARLLLRRSVNWIGGWMAASAVVACHLLLDSLTLSGLSWFWPFSEKIFHFDLIHRGDPWIAILLLIAVFAPFLSRMVSSEIGAKRSTGRGTALVSLVFVLIYVGAKFQIQAQVEDTLKSRIYGGEPSQRIATVPHPQNPFSWTGLIETSKAVFIIPISALGSFDPEDGQSLYPPQPSKMLDTAKHSGEYLRIERYLSWPYWQIIPVDQGYEITIEDLRTGLTLRMIFDENLREIIEQRSLLYPRS